MVGRAAAELNVVPVEEIALVQTTQRPPVFGCRQQKRALNPIHLKRFYSGYAIWTFLRICPEPTELPEEHGPREVTCGGATFAVPAVHLGADDANATIGLEQSNGRRDVRQQHRVGIEQQIILPACIARGKVIALGESEIFFAAQQAHPREFGSDKVRGAICRSVVQENDLVWRSDPVANRVETI